VTVQVQLLFFPFSICYCTPREDSYVGKHTTEFLGLEESIDEKKESFVNSYNYEREHAGIKGRTPVW
jgi:hypothetical protein